MLNHKFLKKLKNFVFHFKFLSLSIIVMAIAIPFIVKAAYNTPSTGYLSPGNTSDLIVFHNKADGVTKDPSGVCVANQTSLTYFIPTKTLAEFDAFWRALPSGIFLYPCCGNGVCDGADTCSNCPSDCGACAPSPCQYIYSPWSGCDANGMKTRTITYQGPANCTGSPESLNTPCCTGCQGSLKCANFYVYSGNYCSGSVLQSNTNICYDGNSFNSCMNPSNNVSIKYTYPSGNCYYDCVNPSTTHAGCPVGSSCRSAAVHYPSSDCTGPVVQSITSTCVSNSTLNNVCQSMSSTNNVGVIFTPGSGCYYTTN